MPECDEPGDWFTLSLLQWALARELIHRNLGELVRYDPVIEIFPIGRIYQDTLYIRANVRLEWDLDSITLELSI